MLEPGTGNNFSVTGVKIECTICNGPSCDFGPNDLLASQIIDVGGQTTVQLPYKVWFGRSDAFDGGHWANYDSYACRIRVGNDSPAMSGQFLMLSQFYSVAWDPTFRWAKVLDTPSPVLELSGTIN